MQTSTLKEKDREIERLKKSKKAVEHEYEVKFKKMELELESERLQRVEKDKILEKMLKNADSNDVTKMENEIIDLKMEISDLKPWAPTNEIKEQLKTIGITYNYDALFQKWISTTEENKKIKNEAVALITEEKMKWVRTIDDLTSKLKSSEENYHEQKQRCLALAAELESQVTSYDELKLSINDIVADRLREKTSELENEFKSKEIKLIDVIEKLEEKGKEKDDLLKESLSRQAWLEESLKEKENDVQIKKKKKSDSDSDSSNDESSGSKKKKIKSLEEAIKSMEEEILSRNNKLEEYKRKVELFEEKSKTAESSLNVLNEKNVKLIEALRSKESQLDTIEKDVENKFADQIQEMKETLNSMMMRSEEKSKKKGSESSSDDEGNGDNFANAELIILREENENLKNQIAEIQNNSPSQNNDVNQGVTLTEYNELKETFKAMEEDKKEILSELIELQKKIGEFKDERNDLLNEIQNVKEENSKLSSQANNHIELKEENEKELNSKLEEKEKELKELLDTKEKEFNELLDTKEKEFNELLDTKEKEYKLIIEEKVSEIQLISHSKDNDHQTLLADKIEEYKRTIELKDDHYHKLLEEKDKLHHDELINKELHSKEELERLKESLTQKAELVSNIKIIELEKEILLLRNTISEFESSINDYKESLQKEKKNHEVELLKIKEEVKSTLRGGEADILRNKLEVLQDHLIKYKLNAVEEIEYYRMELAEAEEDFALAKEKLLLVVQDRDNLRKIIDKMK